MNQYASQANQNCETMLGILVSTYHNMGDRSTSALSQRVGLPQQEGSRILRLLSERGLTRSTHGTFEAKSEWHLTDEGWEKSGQEKPIWMTWGEVA